MAIDNVTLDKKIVHPIFHECAEYTLDPFWQQVFDECARGRFPRGTSINAAGNIVYFRNKDNSFTSYKLDKTPEVIFQDLKELFQKFLNFKSHQDRQDIRDELDNICRDINEIFAGDWKKIKRKKIKEPIIRKYILDLQKEYSLDSKETSQVAQLIKLGFLFNWINNDDVDYKDQRILNIKTLHFDETERTFELEEPDTPQKREYKPKPIKLSTLWDKWLDSPKNRYLV